ncbi:hypothetical protein GCM10009764_67310 [Nocardia ninae]|uniref:Uncharacterized protein n=1 Tax=Nocardia ninae NBRC 108245 TaxID=1210091 RepID=A0A511M8R7_9NOCA|nr:hypothetical protein NN4_10370 [Nocardia ninae NBRC 108245]
MHRAVCDRVVAGPGSVFNAVRRCGHHPVVIGHGMDREGLGGEDARMHSGDTDEQHKHTDQPDWSGYPARDALIDHSAILTPLGYFAQVSHPPPNGCAKGMSTRTRFGYLAQ